MDWIFDPGIWAGLLTLTALEIVLGIDNIVFLSVITGSLPPDRAKQARQIGLALALIFRIALLFTITWITKLTAPVLAIAGQDFSWRDLILIGGGLFLIVKSTQEVHGEIEGEEKPVQNAAAAKAGFGMLIGQIVLIDAIFSLDSIITAIGIGRQIEVMIAAVCISIAVMYLASESVSAFIKRHPTTKMLALSFLMLIGVALVADGFHFHIPRAYIYFAMAFSAAVETFNVLARRSRSGVPRPVASQDSAANEEQATRQAPSGPKQKNEEKAEAVRRASSTGSRAAKAPRGRGKGRKK
jgi:predicted tellurium resistance membrane protein TerC